MVNFPFLDGDIPRSTFYGLYISQHIRIAHVSSHIDNFNICDKVLKSKLKKQGYIYIYIS